MSKPTVEQLLTKTDNKYVLVIEVAKRARQLADGEAPLIDTTETNPIGIAMQEVYEGKITARPPLMNEEEWNAGR